MTRKVNKFCIEGGRVLLPSGETQETEIVISEGKIDAIGVSPVKTVKRIDASGWMVLPGIVDLHGDAFERQIMPRPGVTFPLELAFLDTDRQLVANGITTGFHGITYSWEPGLRGRETVIKVLTALKKVSGGLGAATKCHLRFETFNFAAVDEVVDWISNGEIHFLAFNNHLPSIRKKISKDQPLSQFLERTGLAKMDFLCLVKSLSERESETTQIIEKLAKTARENSISMASHDDKTSTIRQFYNSLGCHISEFPLTAEAIIQAHELDNFIVLGAPNIIRGGSHMGEYGLSASRNIKAGMGDILCSDYYYPALMQAPFSLAKNKILDFGPSWKMVSKVPAEAAGLMDRGEIVVGKRADLILIEQVDFGGLKLKATFVNGSPVYRSCWL